MAPPSRSTADTLRQPLTLATGHALPNRIAKAAMEEAMARIGGGPPNDRHFSLYQEWAKGGYGLIITGNVTVAADHLGTPFDVCIRERTTAADRQRWKRYAQVCTSGDAPAVVQLVHAGRQSIRGSGRAPWDPPLAPSSVQLVTGATLFARTLSKIVFPKPRAMTKADIAKCVEQFRNAARLVNESGFDGVQIHCSHGYLHAQFLSPRTNLRDDEYGGSPRNRMRFLFEVIDAVRKDLPRPFIVGVKLNAADYVDGGLTEDEALEHVRWLQEHGGIDFIEVSGGSYENGAMMEGDGYEMTKSPSQREAFFATFAQRAKATVAETAKSSSHHPVAIMLTGGLRTRTGMAAAIEDGVADLVGLGRPSAVRPRLPLTLVDASVPDNEANCPPYKVRGAALYHLLVPIKVAAAGFQFIWHACAMHQIAAKQEPDLERGFFLAFVQTALPALASVLLIPMLSVGTMIAACAVYMRRA